MRRMGLTPPPTEYAKSGDVHVAYQVTGSGEVDMVLAPGTVSHLGLDWERPRAGRMDRAPELVLQADPL